MQVNQRIPWKDSNLSLIGSDLDHKIKEAAADDETQWEGIGEAPGLKVWRIEDFKVVPWDKLGKFYTGDSYVVLNTYQRNNKLLHDIHIWIGSESSQDEYGTAAYKMVECDEVLGGGAIQHRETQGHESSLFQSYFDDKLEYWTGGSASGFHHVEATDEEPLLYRIKGTQKGLRMTQLPLKKGSLNHGDSFILYASTSSVWIWHGKSANPDEKAKAGTLGEKMCTHGTAVVLDDGDDDDAIDFWKYFGSGEIAEADDKDQTVESFVPVLYRLRQGGEPEQVSKAAAQVKNRFGKADPPIDKDLLVEDEMLLLDAGWELYLWMGKDVQRTEKLQAMTQAEAFSKKDARTMNLPLTLVKSGWESSDFMSHFG
jgi:gelsolin